MHKRQPYELLGDLVYSGISPKGYTNRGTELFEHNPLYDLIQETDTDTKTGSESSV